MNGGESMKTPTNPMGVIPDDLKGKLDNLIAYLDECYEEDIHRVKYLKDLVDYHEEYEEEYKTLTMFINYWDKLKSYKDINETRFYLFLLCNFREYLEMSYDDVIDTLTEIQGRVPYGDRKIVKVYVYDKINLPIRKYLK